VGDRDPVHAELHAGRLPRIACLALVLGSAWTAPLVEIFGLTLTGDRLLGLVAVVIAAGLGVAGRLTWTPVHSALVAFVAAQGLATLANASDWPRGLRFFPIYLLGFACFALSAAWTTRFDTQRWMGRVWIAVGSALGVLATLSALVNTAAQQSFWGSAPMLLWAPGRLVFGGRASSIEPNLFASFLIVPFALALWARKDSPASAGPPGTLGPWLGPLVAGLVTSFTRAGWGAMVGIAALWAWRERPGWRPLARLAAVFLAVSLIHGASILLSATAVPADQLVPAPIGMPRRVPSPLPSGWAWLEAWPPLLRVINPLLTRTDVTLRGRVGISRAAIEAWLDRPLLGQGTGFSNALPSRGASIHHTWTANLILFVLLDSGLVGLGALVALVATVAVAWRKARRAAPGAGVGWASTLPALGASGAWLLFAYQFTHGLWLMYPYVYLGFLTGVLHPAVPGVARVTHETDGA
jgi:hypothetical protein